MSDANHLNRVQQSLGHRFKNPQWLVQALTHRSADQQHYERLEFLGDSLLNFIIAQALFERFPAICEGTLTRLRSQLVNGNVLADIGKELELHPHILLGRGEVRSGGRERTALLADVVEASIGAIYLDSDIETCQHCVYRWYGSRLDTITPDKLEKDPKTSLQEHLQAQRLPLPRYQITDIDGPAHDVIFSAHCSVPGMDQQTLGQGSTRRKAEQAAAKAFLDWLRAPS